MEEQGTMFDGRSRPAGGEPVARGRVEQTSAPGDFNISSGGMERKMQGGGAGHND